MADPNVAPSLASRRKKRIAGGPSAADLQRSRQSTASSKVGGRPEQQAALVARKSRLAGVAVAKGQRRGPQAFTNPPGRQKQALGLRNASSIAPGHTGPKARVGDRPEQQAAKQPDRRTIVAATKGQRRGGLPTMPLPPGRQKQALGLKNASSLAPGRFAKPAGISRPTISNFEGSRSAAIDRRGPVTIESGSTSRLPTPGYKERTFPTRSRSALPRPKVRA